MGKWFMFQSTVVSSSLGSIEPRRSRPLDSKNEDAVHCHMPEDLALHIKSEKHFLFFFSWPCFITKNESHYMGLLYIFCTNAILDLQQSNSEKVAKLRL